MKEVLDFDDQKVGLIMSVASVGSLVGALLVPRARKRFGFASVWLAAFALQGVAMLCMTAPRSMALYMGIGLFIAASLTIRGVLSMSLRQEITPPERLGRVTAAFWLILYSPGPISAALLTRLAERTSITYVYTLIGVGILLLWIIGMLSPLRRYQENREQESGASQ
jgi:MFS family permease